MLYRRCIFPGGAVYIYTYIHIDCFPQCKFQCQAHLGPTFFRDSFLMFSAARATLLPQRA